jgi:tetratricopeptide (TPR) repeat protein
MDTVLTIIIIVGIVIVLAVLFFVFSSKEEDGDESKNTEGYDSAKAEGQADSANSNMGQTRIRQLLSGADLQDNMKEEESELLTKYTAGSGDGIQEVEKLLEGDPGNVDLLDWLAFMYYSNNEIDKAIDTYKRALEIRPDNENQHYYLGNSYYKKNMMDEAKKSWSEVIRLKPSSKIAKNAQERIEFLKSQGK